MRKFDYFSRPFLPQEFSFSREKGLLFMSSYSNYRMGYGYGLTYGSIYNSDSGGGVGNGFDSDYGNGEQSYPYQLIQYWE